MRLLVPRRFRARTQSPVTLFDTSLTNAMVCTHSWALGAHSNVRSEQQLTASSFEFFEVSGRGLKWLFLPMGEDSANAAAGISNSLSIAAGLS